MHAFVASERFFPYFTNLMLSIVSDKCLRPFGIAISINPIN
jgi:hypothetical protein